MFVGANAKCVNRLLVLLVLAARADARAQTAFFAPDPHWESPEPSTTRSVAIGDIDLDGDLDLVCGNSQQANTLFLNDAGTIGTSSSWFPAGIDRTRNVALGDLDGDGYLDLICGNFGGGNTLYLNQHGALSPVPADTLWTSNTAESVALGDMDNDGDLDIVFGIPLFPTAIYYNDSGHFRDPPKLIGGPNETRCVVLGDVDENGYLDVVQSNIGGTARTYVYLNRQSDVDSLPAWSSRAGDQTLGVALADLNGDRRLDLICANFNFPNTIYYHETDSLYAAAPSWQSGPADSGEDVEVGDVDGDGDVDLIIANLGQPTALYLNDLSDTGGTLTTTPAWGTSRPDQTIDIALGDVDGDGDLDLVCGNADELSAAYVNLTPPLELNPSWESIFPEENRTKSVALGDVDGDGDLDLVCGNGGAKDMASTCYFNRDGRFDTAPSWLSAEPRRTASVALAKVNRDDRLDLICGNQGVTGEPSAAFENTGGSFSSTPTWISDPIKVTTSIAVGDINGDGLVDLVCGNGGDSSMVFLNLGSNFDTKPAWTSNDTLQTSGIALGDVDGDGDLDLVCGNNALEDPSTLYLNEGRMFADEPAWSSSQTFFTNDVALGDIDGDGDLDLACANNTQATTVYFNQGGIFAPSAGWSSRPPARPTTSIALGDLDGDGDLDLVCGNELDSLNVAYLNEHGTLNRDPGWISERGYDTEDVVLGDVDGDGDLDAVFGNENGPNVLHAGTKNRPVDPSSPLPGQTNHDAFLSQVKVRRIGPNTQRIVFSLVDVQSDPAWLLVEYQFEGDPNWHFSDVDNRAGRVGPFATGASAIVDSLTWDTSRIPSDLRDIVLRLTAIEVPRRVGVVQRAPSYLVDIGQIPMVDTFARPSSGSEFFETRDVIVDLRLPPGMTRDQARLYYRRGGESEYQQASFQDGSPLPFATIPSDWVGERGIEYWVEAQTGTETLTDPRTNPSERPHAVRITSTNLAESVSHPGERYRMLSIPLALESSVSIIRALQDDIGFPDATRWRLFAYNAGDSTYDEVPNDTTLSFEQGRGYFLITRESHRLDTAPVFGKSAPTDSAFTLNLEPGWNLIGQPFAFPVPWASVGVTATEVEPPVAWQQDHYTYSVDRLEPWQGYWVKNRTSAALGLKIPPVAVTASSTTSSVSSEAEWQLSIGASSNHVVDPVNAVGVKKGARDAWDEADRSDAPMGPGRSLSLYFPKTGGGNFAVDIRGDAASLDEATARIFGVEPDSWGHLWRLDVAKNFADVPAGDVVVLEFSGAANLPPDARVLLLDHSLKRIVDLRQQSRYQFFQGNRDFVANEGEARFTLLVGGDSFADSQEKDSPPSATRLHQNRPNPFNPATIIRYEVGQSAAVTLKVYDVGGAVVRNLFSGNQHPGIYEVLWNAQDVAGEPLASGVYFCRLTAGPVTETRKMLLLK